MRHLRSLAFIALAACGSSGPGMMVSDDQPGDDEQPLGRCTDLDGRSFSSIDLQPDCGLGPDGPEPCHWRVEFNDDGALYTGWTWYHSDVGESGDIRCAGGTQIVTVSDNHTASYDAETDQLQWDDIVYQGQ
jgi:hypothetical protein